MKFNKTLKYDAAQRREQLASLDAVGSGEPISRSSSAKALEACGQVTGSSFGRSGVFIRIRNEANSDCDSFDEASNRQRHYQDEPHWPTEKRESVKKIRYVICTLALFGMAFGLMSRLMLNVSIVEMVKQPQNVLPVESLNITNKEIEITTLTPSVDLIIDGEEAFTTTTAPITETTLASILETQQATVLNDGAANVSVKLLAHQLKPGDADELDFGDGSDDGLHFNWSKQEQNIILGAFYMGYSPGILFGGSIAERYGSKWPLFICIFGSSMINISTPMIARFSLHLLIASRIVLGSIQGSLFPSLYELFNKWLTATESSIFAPMIKVSMPMGSLIGTLMPGVLASFGLEWPLLFYIGGGLCLVWSILWLWLATSTPQTNRFVEEDELERIMRKKRISTGSRKFSLADLTNKMKASKQAPCNNQETTLDPEDRDDKLKSSQQNTRLVASRQDRPKKQSTPWFLIVTNQSVLALTLVKFTYNLGMDFIYLELASYLREAHHASIETISAIASAGYCMQMVLITFVGWLAKSLITRRALGLSVTKWRKVFQGASNFFMALSYIILAITDPGLEFAACLLLSVCFFWMLGAGGESMVPYDLSSKYPASIMGFAHSVSIVSGITIPAICSIILGENTEDHSRWNLMYILMAGALAFGGIVFCLLLKAKPFLPGEKNRAPGRNVTCTKQQKSGANIPGTSCE